MNELGEHLKDLRGKKSLREVAKATGISHSYLSTLEKGYDPRTKKGRQPSHDTLKKLSSYYNVPYYDLLEKAGYVDAETIEFIESLKGFNEEMQEINKHNIRLLLLNDEYLHWDEKILTDKQRQDILNFIQNEIIGTEGGYYLFDFADKKKDGE